MDPLLEVRGLNVAYHTNKGILTALHNVSFEVLPQQIIGVVGETGCGKSTVAASVMRLLPPNGEITSGEIQFKGKDLVQESEEALRRMRGRELTMIFQDPMSSLNPVFTIGAQMLDIQRAHSGENGNAHKNLLERAVTMLEQVGIPDAADRVHHYPDQFSGGMRQRIMIAMALLSQPELLIADEPTASLDVTLEAQILELIKDLRRKFNTAVMYISHNLGVIAQLCDQVMVMYAGRVVEARPVYTLFADPLHPYTQALLDAVPSRRNSGERLATIPGTVPSLLALPTGCKFSDRCPKVRLICKEIEPRYLAQPDGYVRCHIYDPESGYSEQASLPGLAQEAIPSEQSPQITVHESRSSADHPTEPLIKLRDVSTYFSDRMNIFEQLMRKRKSVVRAVDQVSLDIEHGEVIGIVGESGSGKTTLGRTILRLIPPTSGQIQYGGQDVSQVNREEMRRLRINMQMIFQDPYASLSPRLRVSYLLSEPYMIHKIQPDQQYTVSQLLHMVGLAEEQSDKYAHELSGGQARRVGIARALALNPDFIVADEPTSGLDVSVAASILNLMKDLAEQFDLTYIIITHDLNVVGYISDRVAVMYMGKLVEVGPTIELFEKPYHPYTLALLSAISEPDPTLRQREERLLLSGEIPSPKNPPPGCRFHTRCPFANERCQQEVPQLEVVSNGRQVACHHWQSLQATGFEGKTS